MDIKPVQNQILVLESITLRTIIINQIEGHAHTQHMVDSTITFISTQRSPKADKHQNLIRI